MTITRIKGHQVKKSDGTPLEEWIADVDTRLTTAEGLTSQIPDKAASVHGHSAADIVGLIDLLDATSIALDEANLNSTEAKETSVANAALLQELSEMIDDIAAGSVISINGQTGAVVLDIDAAVAGKLDAYTVTSTSTSKTLANRERCLVTTEGLTITLPTSPQAGWEVSISVEDFTNTVINRNGEMIMGLAENITINKSNCTLTLMYFNSTYGWRII